MKVSLMIILLAAAAACTQPQQEIKELYLERHNTVYTFSYDVREALQVPLENQSGVLQTIAANNRIIIAFNGTSESDNALFAVTSFNIAEKLDRYFFNEFVDVYFDVTYFVNGTWHNRTGETAEPDLDGTVIWLVGPDTGAKRNAVYMNDGVIYVEGTDSKGIVLAGDRLALLVMGIQKFEDIKDSRP